MTKQGRKVGLALSGGGYRATAFHLGTLNKLHELGVLDNIDVMSTISGGSITGAAWCLHNGDHASFQVKMRHALQTKSVIGFVLKSWIFWRFILLAIGCIAGSIWLTFTQWAPYSTLCLVLYFIVFLKFQYQLFPVSRVIERAYDQFFFANKQLKDLKEQPVLAIGSSNLHTGRPFTFSKKKMADSSYSFRTEYATPIEFSGANFPVSRAVMASSCVPQFFSPVMIDQCFFKVPEDYHRIKPVLMDGGIYDNQGIQKLTQPKSSYECQIVIVSDAGGWFIADKHYRNVFSILVRTVDLFMFRIKTAQMVQHIYRNVDQAGKPIAYFSLGWDIENAIPGFYKNLCDGTILQEVIDAHRFNSAWIANPSDYKIEIMQHLEVRTGMAALRKRDLTPEQRQQAQKITTNLTKLPADEVAYLIQHAENLTEIQVKLYCPMLLP
jgi:NTE family protein